MMSADLNGHKAKNANPVQELQLSVNAAFTDPKPKPTSNSSKLSRAAHLHLINHLARFAPTAIFAIFTATLYLAITHIAANPLNVTIWAFIVFGAGITALIKSLAYRAGDKKIASRPFHWRACHTANLSVLSMAFGASALLLLGQQSTSFPYIPSLSRIISNDMMILGLVCITSIFASFTQLANPKSALAISLPALIMCTIGFFLSNQGMMTLMTSTAILAFSGAYLYVTAIRAYNRVAMRYPRTTAPNEETRYQRVPSQTRRQRITAPSRHIATHKDTQQEPRIYA